VAPTNAALAKAKVIIVLPIFSIGFPLIPPLSPAGERMDISTVPWRNGVPTRYEIEKGAVEIAATALIAVSGIFPTAA